MGRLVVAVPADRFRMPPSTGAGRVWNSVLPRLRRFARVRPAGGLPGRRPDVWLLPALGRPVAARAPVVAVIHGSAWMLDADVLDLMPREFAEPFVAGMEETLARTSVAIVPSRYTQRGLTEGYGMPEERVFVVPHGVDADVFNPARSGGRELVASALGRERPYVLFASIPSIRQKNLTVLKEAMVGLARRGLPHALVIAGGTAGGESPAVLEQIADDLPGLPGRVAWLGHVGDRDLAALMTEADAFCLPSLFESFGLTALEAMACGAPVVVSNRGALPEVVGDAALLSEPEPEPLEAALLRVLTDAEVADRLRAAGRARAETMSWERTAKGWLAALEQAAAER
jgi:glycosyltransferase involved in cell wall biosynthesis